MFQKIDSTRYLTLTDGTYLLGIEPINKRTVRVRFTKKDVFTDSESLIIEKQPDFTEYDTLETDTQFSVCTSAVAVNVSKETGAVMFLDTAGHVILREAHSGSKFLAEKAVHKNIYPDIPEAVARKSVDGIQVHALHSETVFDRNAYEAKLSFEFDDDEALFGLGSHEEGYGSLRGKSRTLYQQNFKACVPVLVSTKGYGVVINCGSLMTFRDDAYGSYFWMDTVDELDYYFIFGGDADGVTKAYHTLTGKTPMLPKWAFGYMQSKERYQTQDELLDIVNEYRARNISIDTIILDWQYWPLDGGWGQKSMEESRFPNPKLLTETLHKTGAKLMVSVWPIMSGGCPNQMEMLDCGGMLGNGSTYNAFDENARKCYWEQANRGLFRYGLDAWWCDCVEPFEEDWRGEFKPEPHIRTQINSNVSKRYIDDAMISLYSLYHSKGIYDGQRSVTDKKRVLNLTRSSYAGQHRYGTVTWSGDVSANWETLSRSIPEGVNFCATGEAYWTADIGGFFVRDEGYWFTKGEYPNGCEDMGYRELYTRWFQYGAFLPLFRSHGTHTPREVWRFGEKGTMFYDTLVKFIELRYRLLPYIYSISANVSINGGSMLKGVALGYPEDADAHDLTDQYLFGDFMVCPVTEPMYYKTNSVPLDGIAKSREVYLPKGKMWYDFWTNTATGGGIYVLADAPIEKMPLYLPAGAIVVTGADMQYTDEIPDAPYTINIYAGENGSFMIYEDDGVSYGYEQGAYATVQLGWNQNSRTLSIGERAGTFDGLTETRQFIIRYIDADGVCEQSVMYNGNVVTVIF